jgi:hypothetical protein
LEEAQELFPALLKPLGHMLQVGGCLLLILIEHSPRKGMDGMRGME